MTKPSVKSNLGRFARSVGNGFIRHSTVAMFHTGRCGSRVTANMLRQHPDIHWGGEIFNPYFKERIKLPNFVRSAINRSSNTKITKFYGFETKYLPMQHLNEVCIDMEVSEYVDHLQELGIKKFIVLQRKNYLRRAISAHVGGIKKQLHSAKEVKNATKVHLDPKSFSIGMTSMPLLEVFEITDDSYSQLSKKLSSADCLFLTYEEDIFQNPLVAYDKIREHWGLGTFTPEVRLKKTNAFALPEILENYEEIESTLSGTKFEWMLR